LNGTSVVAVVANALRENSSAYYQGIDKSLELIHSKYTQLT